LTSTNGREPQTKFQAVTVGLLNGTNSLGVDINNGVQGYHTNEKLLKSSTVGDMWSRLDLQERRTRDAELLAAAAGAISASLDLQVTLLKVAEQAGHLLQLENAAVFLFDETGEVMSPYIWSRDNSSRLESLRDLAAMLKQTDAVFLVRER